MDYYTVYLVSDAMAPGFCGTPLTPNAISFLHGIVITAFTMYNLYMHRSVNEFALLMAARSFLDGLDGSVARACHNGSPMGADIDTALDFLPAILCLHFAWYRIAWPSFYHKVGLPIFMITGGIASSGCNHDPDASLYCYYYYPNANTLPFILATALKYFAMNHKMPAWELEYLPGLPTYRVRT